MLKKVILFLIIISLTGFVYSQDIEQQVKKHYQMGDSYYQQGRYKEAKEEYQKALDLLSQQDVSKAEKVRLERQGIAPQEKESAVEYTIGLEDVLHISVWQNPDLDQEVIVRPDGRISFPLVGDVSAVGLSITRLDQELTERLKEYIRFPEVSISIKKIGGRKIIILGEVGDPGVYSLTGTERILEAIGMAGGFTEDAVSSSTVLIRGGLDKPQAKRINLTKAIARGDMRQNIILQSEDIIFVPKKFIANLNYVLRQIITPARTGRYDVELLGD